LVKKKVEVFTPNYILDGYGWKEEVVGYQYPSLPVSPVKKTTI